MIQREMSPRSLDIELYVPVKVVPPALRRRFQAESDVKRRQPMRLSGWTYQVHSGFLRGPTALLVVAPETGSDNVIPAFLPAAGNRNHMVEREIFGRELLGAVLTGIVVPGINVRPRKLHFVVIFDANVLEQADNRGQADGKRDRMNLAIVLFDNLYFSGEKQRQSFLP